MRLDHLLSKEKEKIRLVLFIFECVYGDVAQLARASALHAEGREFDSCHLHHLFYLKPNILNKIIHIQRNSTLKNI